MRRSLLPFLLALAIPLAAPAVAGAGGFATAGLSSTPDDVAAGKPWNVDITVLQHGQTPLEGSDAARRISSGDSDSRVRRQADRQAGVYRAASCSRRAGRWDYEVLDGFIDELPHTFPAVRDRRRRRCPGGAVAPDRHRPRPRRRRRRHRGRLAVGRRRGAGCSRCSCSAPTGCAAGRRPTAGGRAGVRPATIAAGVLACAAAAMAVAALAPAGGEEERRRRRGRERRRRSLPRCATARRSGSQHGCGSLPRVRRARTRAGSSGPTSASTLKGVPATYIEESIVAPAQGRRRRLRGRG